MIDHVVAAPAALAATGTYPVADLRAALAQAGVELATSIGQVRYAGECQMPGGAGRHLVLEGSYGRVTLIVGPPGAVPMFAPSVTRAGFYAELMRSRDRAIGIVTTDRSTLEAVASLLRSS